MIFQVSGITFRNQNQLKIVYKTTCVQKRPQDAAKTRQDVPKTPQDDPKTASRCTQDAPRRPQDAPKTPQDASRRLQDTSRRLQDAILMGFGSQNGAKLAPKSLPETILC